MRRTWKLGGLLLALLPTTAWAADPFSAADRRHERIPTGHVPGKDNGAGEGLHFGGEDCGNCHTPGGKAESRVFTVAGTLWEDRAARRPLQGGEVVLEDIDGNVISMTSNAAGNFWTTAPLASNPLAVASHGGVTELLYGTDGLGAFVPADPADPRTWQYKAWVRNGDHVQPMVTIAPVGGATASTQRMGCNMHHAPMGSRGGLSAAGGSTLGEVPEESVRFRLHVRPILVSRCVPCHVPGATLTRPVTETDLDPLAPTTYDYSSGVDLTRYSATGQKLGIRDLVDVDVPDASQLLAKPRRHDGEPKLLHAGGEHWTADDADFRTIRAWIAAGARDD